MLDLIFEDFILNRGMSSQEEGNSHLARDARIVVRYARNQIKEELYVIKNPNERSNGLLKKAKLKTAPRIKRKLPVVIIL